ncbi:MAG: cytochrome c [Alphaproteobacteria bacterium]|jgi:mono/diheme cytochrome c family protein|nr:cytochrome c [Alphaproteobacteria bacterium]|tara:strand:- start:112 stop:525 length:414 start_codon:yes stop_codon:yes gene_type:complete
MRLTGALLSAAIILGAGFGVPAAAGDADKADPTRREAWRAGNASGEGNYQSYCVTCHGVEGKGDGPLSEDLDVKPRDLSDPAFASAKSDQHLFKVIKFGGASVGLSENMAPFSGQLSDKEINNVVAYLRSEICKCGS